MSGNTLTHEPPAPPAAEAETPAPEIQRAEEIVDRLGQQLGEYAVRLSRSFSIWTARLREEAEDILAEAESIRRGEPQR